MADFDLSMAITADGSEAVTELGAVDQAQDNLTKGQKELDDQTKRNTKSAEDLRKQLKANADAINAVIRATNPAVGSQRALDAAVKSVERAYINGKVSAELYAKAQTIASRATFATATNMRQTQQGTRQLGLQFNDLGTQIAAGINPMVAFTQQAGQMGYAMSQMGGAAGKFGSFLAGGWGALILVGASVLGNFITKMLDAKKAAENLTEAQKLHAMSAEELRKAIEDQNAALEKEIRTEEQSRQAALDSAQAKLTETIQRREHIKALLEEAKAAAALEQAHPSGTTMGVGGGVTVSGAIAANLDKQLAENQAALTQAQRGVALAEVPIARANAKAATDKAAAITKAYNDAVAKATDEFVNHGRDLNKLNKALDAAEIEQKRANDALREANKKPRVVSLGDQLSAQTGADILAAARSHIGEKEGNPNLAEFLRGQNIDPEKAAWCAAFINAVLSSRGIKGTGSNAANSFLGFGSATETPQAGDIVVLHSKASPSGFHAGFFAGTKGNQVQVVGGNQGGGTKVQTSNFPLSAVAGFRRLPTAADQFKDEQQLAKQAEQDAKQLANFGQQAARTIDSLGGKALGTLGQANDQTDQLNKLMEEVEQRKPPNLEELRKNAAQARKDIQDGILKPFNDFVKANEQSLQVEKLRAAGMSDEAETLQEVYRQQEAIGKDLLPEQIKQIYEIVQARKAETAEVQRTAKAQQDYLRDLDQYKDVFRTLLSGNKQDVKDFPKNFLKVVQQQSADKLFDQIFGGLFQSLEDDKTGVSKVKKSNTNLAATADKAADAVLRLANSANTAAGAVAGETGTSGLPEDIVQGISSSPLGDLVNRLLGRGININGKSVQGIGDVFKGIFSQQGLQFGASIVNSLFGGVGQMSGQVKGGKLSDALGSIAQVVGQAVPQAGIAMAATSLISKAIGVKNFAGGIFGVVGNVVAKLLGFGKVKSASATVTSAYGDIPVTGKSAGGPLDTAATNAGQAIQEGLQNILATLGGTLGQFAVSIGVRKGKYVVDPTGQGRTKGDNTPSFATGEEAVAYAILDAIKDGAIKGLSAAVQKALNSSNDLDKALREAVKVQDLEQALAGITGQMDKAFRDFEQTAQERVRIAKTYGLDLVKTEELNAKERAKLLDDILKQRVGDLQNFLDEMKFGNLFEGTAAEQRTALLAEVARVRTQADAGEEGAASKLADLERQLLELSRTAYGTAGPEYAADRAAAQADAERIIAEETARAKEAQDRAIATLNAATTQNDLTQTTNDILTDILTTIQNGATTGTGSPLGGGHVGRLTVLY